jgi:Trk-type K+ transport system membrane component
MQELGSWAPQNLLKTHIDFITANSAFTDLGFTLTPDSMISFQEAIWPLLLMSYLIIIGNTGFPIMLRVIIWVTSVYVPKESGIWEELKFLLDHPRRCFTLLFPSKATWWLFWILVILNGLDLLFFIVLDVSIGSFKLPTC